MQASLLLVLRPDDVVVRKPHGHGRDAEVRGRPSHAARVTDVEPHD